ncbi:Rieske (2Fe-2S) protein [Caulobacter sp. KR2-114]|uniref:Rieske (2Fe-2S) protein n=1 Tax=Caulobacter sp. KR2-114 TaxID=3400912 RepID=UPI003BFD2D73
MRDNPAQPAAGHRLCALAEIADPGAKGFSFREGDKLFMGFLVRQGDQVFGYIDRCPHAGLPLATFGERFLTREGDLILCSSHGALFRPRDGLCIGGPCAGKALWPWRVRVEDGAVVAG